jgi:hypothetical protein
MCWNQKALAEGRWIHPEHACVDADYKQYLYTVAWKTIPHMFTFHDIAITFLTSDGACSAMYKPATKWWMGHWSPVRERLWYKWRRCPTWWRGHTHRLHMLALIRSFSKWVPSIKKVILKPSASHHRYNGIHNKRWWPFFKKSQKQFFLCCYSEFCLSKCWQFVINKNLSFGSWGGWPRDWERKGESLYWVKIGHHLYIDL